MKHVNLVEYFRLAEALTDAKRSTSVDQTKGGNIWVSTAELPTKLNRFINDDNGFSTSKHIAKDLAEEIESWIAENIYTDSSPPQLMSDRLNQDFHQWQYSNIPSKIDAFNSVFAAECRDVDVYSVGQISIYRTSALVTQGSHIIPGDARAEIPQEAIKEFDDAGRCLAFDLPTACGFHALRGLELTMDAYLQAFDVPTKNMKSWNDYITAAKKLADNTDAIKRPSAKVAAMLDRMRELDRNPLMHPRDTLDEVSANMLFQLSAITAVEMIKDIKSNNALLPLLSSNPPAQTHARTSKRTSPSPQEE